MHQVLTLIFLIFTPLCFSSEFANVHQYEEWERAKIYAQAVELYPEQKVKFENNTPFVSEAAFLNKYKNATVIKLTNITKELGSLAWFFDIYNGYNNDKTSSQFEEQMGFWNNIAFKRTRAERTDHQTVEKLLLAFYEQNFISDYIKVKHAVEKYIHASLFQTLKRSELKRLDKNHLELTEEQEWTLCRLFVEKISGNTSNLELFYTNLDKAKKSEKYKNLYLAGEYCTGKAFFFRGQSGQQNAIDFFESNHGFNYEKTLRELLSYERTNQDKIFLYRSTKPFRKDGFTLIDSTTKGDFAKGPFTSLSFAQSVFSNIFDDCGASPLLYWGKNCQMYRLTFSKGEARDLIKRKLIVFRPYFGLTNVFCGGGEWHPRTGLPSVCFHNGTWNRHLLDFNCFNTMGGHPADVKHSESFFNSALEAKVHEKTIINEVILPHMTMIGHNPAFNNLKDDLQRYIESLFKA